MTLHHDVRGDGPAVLLVHAGVADSRMWPGVAGQLAATHRVVTCDLRGFGKSPLPPERFSHAADLVALLDELGIERAAVVGASFGGYVALELALRAPGRVMALALLDPFLDEFDPSGEFAAFAEAEEAALDAGDVEEDELDPPVSARLAEIRVPALVVVGADDVEDFHRIARRLADELPGARPLVTIPGAAHLPALERPAEVAGLLLEFLAGVGRAPTPR